MIRTLFFIIFILANVQANAQELIKDGNCYYYGSEKICDSKLIDDLFSSNLTALHWHMKSKSSNRKANVFGGLSLGCIAFGALLLKNTNSGGDSPNFAPLVFGLGLGVLSCVFGTIGIISLSNHNVQTDKAINTFNGISFDYNNNKESISVSFETVDNGLGFVFTF